MSEVLAVLIGSGITGVASSAAVYLTNRHTRSLAADQMYEARLAARRERKQDAYIDLTDLAIQVHGAIWKSDTIELEISDEQWRRVFAKGHALGSSDVRSALQRLQQLLIQARTARMEAGIARAMTPMRHDAEERARVLQQAQELSDELRAHCDMFIDLLNSELSD